jgi:hypothetical protein
MKSFWQIWLTPIVMGILTVFGLLAALLGVGVWHWLSWLALIMPLAVIARYLWWKPVKGKR